jgi:hypothetical protein
MHPKWMHYIDDKMKDPLRISGKLVRLRAVGTVGSRAAAAGEERQRSYVGILPRPSQLESPDGVSPAEGRFFGAVSVAEASCFQLLYVPGDDYVLRSLTQLGGWRVGKTQCIDIVFYVLCSMHVASSGSSSGYNV